MHDFVFANLGPTTNHTKIQGFLDPIDGKVWLKWKRPTKNGLDILPDRAAFQCSGHLEFFGNQGWEF